MLLSEVNFQAMFEAQQALAHVILESCRRARAETAVRRQIDVADFPLSPGELLSASAVGADAERVDLGEDRLQLADEATERAPELECIERISP